MNIINTQNNLAVLAQKEIEINKLIEEQRKLTLSEIEQVLDYTDEEKEKIDDLMKVVNSIDYFIKEGIDFENDFRYFDIYYNLSSPRIQKHFEEIYKDIKIKYLESKIKSITNSRANGKKVSENDLNKYKKELDSLRGGK